MAGGRPTRVDDEQLTDTVADLVVANDQGWCTTADVAAELPMHRSSVLKRLKRAADADDISVEKWEPFARGGYLWRVRN